MEKIFKDIGIKLEKLDFESIWPGFKKYPYAIYNKEKVFLDGKAIDIDNRFMGNTSIDFEGKELAIWYIEDKNNIDIELLTSNLIHEMFHSYQKESGEKRFPNELKGLDYPRIDENYQIKYQEAKILISMLDLDIEDREDFFKKIINYRNYRYNKFGRDLLYEFKIETVEGIAEYVGLKSLKHLSKLKYENQLDMYKKLLLDYKNVFDTRRYSYYMGLVILLAIDGLDIDIDRSIGGGETLVENLLNKKDMNRPVEFRKDESLSKKYKEYIEGYRNKFINFKKKMIKLDRKDSRIIMYDPMNMYKNDDEIIHEHFLGLEYENKEVEILEGQFMTKLDSKDRDKVIEVYKAIEE